MQLKRAVKINTRYQYNPEQNKEIENHIKDLINQGLVSTCARPKPVAPIAVAKDLIIFSFTEDEYTHLHPRMRIQSDFMIVLLSTVGLRPGEVGESEAWYKSNEGLLYKDIDLVYSEKDGWALYLKLRNRKGHREYKKHS
jgi:hypothetical protein